ncbi:Guanine deaminase [Clostridiaceae bacterium JG1575]|nr:Guanine deaminase [Clostridiaceae bacterium JG1575]
MNRFCLLGDFISAPTPELLVEHPGSCLLIEEGRQVGFFDRPPEGCPVLDYRGHLIIPSFIDLHVHAAQYPNMGLGMDLPLLPWLDAYTFPLEMRYAEAAYAKRVYPAFWQALWRSGSLRACVFSSIHEEATNLLMDQGQESGLIAYVGKVNMDRNAPEGLRESTQDSLAATERWLRKNQSLSHRIRPMITPRFVPSCTQELMQGLGALAQQYNVPVQSHINENQDEVAWVASLHPEAPDYLGVYEAFDLIRPQQTILAHAIYNTPREEEAYAAQSIFLAHCPNANLNMSSGMMKCAHLLRRGDILMGLGSDVAGGNTLFIPRVMVNAMRTSNLLHLTDPTDDPLTLSEAFYLGTRGSGRFFGDCGAFCPDFSADLLVLNDEKARGLRPMTLTERLSRFVFSGDPQEIVLRMLEGRSLPDPLAAPQS